MGEPGAPATGPAGPVAAILTGHTGRVRLFRRILAGVRDVDGLPGPAVEGSIDGVRVLVLGTGMGGPTTVRATRAVASRGCQVVVRAGGAGPVAAGVGVGDIVVASAAVRHEGSSAAFLPETWPALADPDVVSALCAASTQAGVTWRAGVVHSKDSFFGEVDPGASPVESRLRERWSAWQRLGVLASEMEAAALFAAATHLGLRAGAVLRVNDVAAQSGDVEEAERQLCEIAVLGAARAADAHA